MQFGNLLFDESLFNSRLCFSPLVKALKKNIAEGNPGMKKLYGHVVQEFESYRGLEGFFQRHAAVDQHAAHRGQVGHGEDEHRCVFTLQTPGCICFAPI